MKRGSILVEVVIAIMILSISGSFIVKQLIESNKSIQNRNLNIDIKSYLNALTYDIKYNLPKEKIEELFGEDNNLFIKYDENFIDDIKNNNIENLINKEKNNEYSIELTKLSEDEKYINFELKATTYRNHEFNIKKEFYKSWWMDEE